MHFFTFNIGDWNKKTSHLSLTEEFVYFKLVCFCYETELPIPADPAPVIRKLRLQKHQAIVESVLAEFFLKTPEGWTNKRCLEELEIIYKRSEKARESANERWKAYRLKLQGNVDATAMRPHTERNANAMLEPCAGDATQDTIPNTQDTNNPIPKVANALFDDFWKSWPQGFGDKGSRKNAEKEFRKISPDNFLLAKMEEAVLIQARDKASKAQTGIFVPNFKHVERWLKGREWENELDVKPALSAEEVQQDFINRHSDTSWAN